MNNNMIKAYKYSEFIGKFNSVDEAAYKLGISPDSIKRCLSGKQCRTREGYGFDYDDFLYLSGFEYPYYITIDNEKVHMDDTYFDENHRLRRKVK